MAISYRNLKLGAVLAFFMVSSVLSVFAGNFILKYEQVVTDSYGNEIGYRTSSITNLSQLPAGSPWRDYLNLKLDSGKTIYQYASTISKNLNKDFTLTISDRDSNSYSCKTGSGYNVNLYGYVNNYASDASKTFLFLHEFGHTTMLNSYPGSYDFNDLNYGTDGVHYLDEILPNYNTAWVEGWANAFGAYNNKGKVFSIDINSVSSLSFLSDNTFEQMTRNELFVSKAVYDFMKRIPGGQASVYDTFAKSGPHNSLYDFCNAYAKLYPANKAAIAQVLVECSQGKATLDDILLYVNGGSRTVSRDLYNYLTGAGLIKTSTGNQVASNNNTSNTQKQSFFGRIFSWFAGLFSSKEAGSGVASSVGSALNSVLSPSVGQSANGGSDYKISLDGSLAVKGSVGQGSGAVSAASPTVDAKITNADYDDYPALQEMYYTHFAEYNKLMLDGNGDKERINAVRQKMIAVKNKLKELEKGR
ncbi:MAG: hypothetical protein PHF29_02465 [Candidatus Riflebacteria bacterium]|nr:hypothetical protein [Candidatus Riflebacteria bacterium]